MADEAISVVERTAPLTTPRVRNQRWAVVRRALTARGAPFGMAVVVLVRL